VSAGYWWDDGINKNEKDRLLKSVSDERQERSRPRMADNDSWLR